MAVPRVGCDSATFEQGAFEVDLRQRMHLVRVSTRQIHHRTALRRTAAVISNQQSAVLIVSSGDADVHVAPVVDIDR